MDATNVVHQEVENYYISNDTFYRKLDKIEEMKIEKALQSAKKQANNPHIKEIEDLMLSNYEFQKKNVGLKMEKIKH